MSRCAVPVTSRNVSATRILAGLRASSSEDNSTPPPYAALLLMRCRHDNTPRATLRSNAVVATFSPNRGPSRRWKAYKLAANDTLRRNSATTTPLAELSKAHARSNAAKARKCLTDVPCTTKQYASVRDTNWRACTKRESRMRSILFTTEERRHRSTK